jgi:hypothetical protein
MDNGVHAWGMSSSKYVQEAVSNAETFLAENFGGKKLTKKARGPWPTDYASEMDTSPELSPKLDITTSRKLEFCIGLWSWDELTL